VKPPALLAFVLLVVVVFGHYHEHGAASGPATEPHLTWSCRTLGRWPWLKGDCEGWTVGWAGLAIGLALVGGAGFASLRLGRPARA